MGGISNRLSKLEQAARTAKGIIRSKAVRDQLVSGLAVAASNCASWSDVAAYLKSLAPARTGRSPADEQQRDDAVRAAMSRTLYEESRAVVAAAGGEHGGH